MRSSLRARRLFGAGILLLAAFARLSWAADGVPAALPSVLDVATGEGGIRWKSLLEQSFYFLALEHGFRVATDPGTRDGLGGHFIDGWFRSAANLHGWADGDPFLINYVGHPLQGSVSGYLLVRNDPKYRRVEFGRNRDYWRSRLRAAAWAWAYSEEFEIGQVSEASIGKVQAHYPQQGFVDHVITPTIGMGWIVGEDAMDRYVIRRIEERTSNKLVRIAARGFLNPSRSLANVLGGELPWHRDTREGVSSYLAAPRGAEETTAGIRSTYHNDRAYAPFELTVQYGFTQIGAGERNSLSCNGGAGAVQFNLNRHFGLEGEVGGCKVVSTVPNVSGDATFYMAGARYTFRNSGRWSPYIHALAGGEKITAEILYPGIRASLPEGSGLQNYQEHALYTADSETNVLALKLGVGVDYAINRALALRVGGLDYLRTGADDFNGAGLNHTGLHQNIQFTSGLVLKMGTW